MVLYQTDYFGFSPRVIGTYLVTPSISAGVGILVGGHLADRIPCCVIAPIGFSLQAIGLFSLGVIHPTVTFFLLIPEMVAAN